MISFFFLRARKKGEEEFPIFYTVNKTVVLETATITPFSRSLSTPDWIGCRLERNAIPISLHGWTSIKHRSVQNLTAFLFEAIFTVPKYIKNSRTDFHYIMSHLISFSLWSHITHLTV
jgi:hypothetical protein